MGLLLGERLPKISDVGFRTVESKTVLPTNDRTFCKINFYFEGLLIKGLFIWRKGYPSTRKILEGETTFRLVYMQKFRSRRVGHQVEKESKTERPAAATFVFLVPTTRTFRAKVVYIVLGSSYL